jgi:hypothetical protein
VPTIRQPEDHTTIRLWNELPIGASEAVPKISRAPTYCSCPGVWCEGRTSRHWLTCEASCRACNPVRRRRRGATDDPGSRFYQGSEDPGPTLEHPA